MELTTLLQQIDSLKKEAESLQPVNPDYERVFWDKFRLEFNYNSNHMEGNTLTYGHTQLLLIFGKVTGDYDLREVEEMKAHDAALKKIVEDAADPNVAFTEKLIKDINSIILVEPYYRDAVDTAGAPSKKLITPGNYKELPNHVQLQNGEIFRFSAPEETRAHMGDLMEWYRKEIETKKLHPVQLAALFHYQFIRIHPFDDGNGRTVRLLMNYILIKYGYAPLVVESVDKKNYIAALNKADTGDINAFIDYITTLSLRWQELFTKAIKGEKIEEPDDFDKEIKILKQKFKTSKDKIEKIFTPRILSETYLSTVKKVIFAIYSKLALFEEFFVKNEILIEYRKHDRTWTKQKGGRESFEIMFNNSIEQTQKNDFPIKFNYNFIHNHLKKATAADFSYTTKILIEFNLSGYLIFLEGDKNIKIEKYYHQDFTDEELNQISELISRKELIAIKKKS